MANPPITIGPFDNVPAPGSPIRSNWAQEISTWVLTSPRWTQIVGTTALSAGNGYKDVFTSPPDTSNYNRITEVRGTFAWGYNAGGSVNGNAAIIRSSDASTAVQGPGEHGSGGALHWGAISLFTQFTSAPGVNAGFKCSIIIGGAPAGANAGWWDLMYRIVQTQ
jgi:hypothetical protein